MSPHTDFAALRLDVVELDRCDSRPLIDGTQLRIESAGRPVRFAALYEDARCVTGPVAVQRCELRLAIIELTFRERIFPADVIPVADVQRQRNRAIGVDARRQLR